MLVLTRKRDESIMIGDDIKIIVVDVRGDQVKLGIEAPRHIPVHREEVYKEIQEENRRAALRETQDLSALDQVLQRPIGLSAGTEQTPRQTESGERTSFVGKNTAGSIDSKETDSR